MKYLVILSTLFFQFACTPAFALRPSNVILFNAQANTTGAKNSLVIDAQNIVSGSLQASFSDGAAAGTLVLQCSNDNPSLIFAGSATPVPVNWSTCTNGTINASATVASGALTFMSLQWLNSRWLRVQWTRSGGAGTLTVTGQFQAQ